MARDTLCRISYDALVQAGITPSAVVPSQMQLYFRGKQVPMYVSAEDDGSFDSNDYIIFFGKRNDGAMDSVLYEDPNDQLNKNYSTYSDTSSYFLTWNSTTPVKRLQYYKEPYTAGTVPDYYTEVARLYLNNIYSLGVPVNSVFNYYGSEYDPGEGWMSGQIGIGGSKDFVISTPNFVSAVDIPQFEILAFSQSNDPSLNPDHDFQVMVGPNSSSLRLLIDTVFEGYKQIHMVRQLINRDLNTQIVVRVISAGRPNVASDFSSVVYIGVKYLRDFSFTKDEKRFFSYADISGNPEVRFKFFGNGLTAQPPMMIMDLDNDVIADGTYDGADVYFNLPSTHKQTHYFMMNKAKIYDVKLSEVHFTKPDVNGGYNYLIVTNRILQDGAQAFADYKASLKMDSTTNFKPYIVYVNDLYDQFFYGLHHPAAIQNFLAYYVKNAPVIPKYLFLLGKGQQPGSIRQNYKMDLVPTVGLPSSDVMFVSGIDNGFVGKDTSVLPPMIIGRLSAHNSNEILSYLTKLKEYDASGKEIWHKEVIHIGGGEASQQAAIRNRLRLFETIISGPYVGCHVKSVFANMPVEVWVDGRATIQSYINEGAQLFTYLGHGSAALLGVDIGKLDSLKNKGKYPIMYFNGCNVGDIGAPTSMGELYLVTPDKGAIAWLGHSNATFDGLLYSQMNEFYNVLSRSIDKPTVGEVWLKTLTNQRKTYRTDPLARSTALEWIIQGDPSVEFKFIPKPDYGISDSTMFISPPYVLANDDSFAVAVPITNYGSTDPHPVVVRLEHHLPDGSVTTYPDFIMNPIYFRDTAFIWIKRNQRRLQGNNGFCVTIDPDKDANEVTWDNNHACFNFFFPGTGARGLYPMNFGVVGTDKPVMVAQSKNLFDNSAAIIFQIDTTPAFNSPFLITSDAIKGNNLVNYRPQLLQNDSTVYYWRTRISSSTDTADWDFSRSFTYIKGSSDGWSQSRWPQFKNSITGFDIIVDTTINYFHFHSNPETYEISTNAFVSSNMGIRPKNGLFISYCSYTDKTLKMSVLDHRSLNILSKSVTKNCFRPDPPTLDVQYTQYNMRDSTDRERFVEDVGKIHYGDYALIVSIGPKQGMKGWSEDVFKAFTSIGVKNIRTTVRDSVAFAFAGQKRTVVGRLLTNMDDPARGDAEIYNYDTLPTKATAKQLENIDPQKAKDVAMATVVLEGIQNGQGSIESELIGPGTKWKMAYQKFTGMEDTVYDKYYLQIIGRDTSGREVLLYDNITKPSYDLSKIDAKRYPFLRLKAVLTDSFNWTPPQLKIWTVLFDAIPEGTLSTEADYAFHKDTLNQGDTLSMKIRFKNISNITMFPLLVRTTVYNLRNSVVYTRDTIYKAGVAANSSILLNEKVDTREISGANILTISVNPDFDQPEMSLDNNYIKTPFYVRTDKANPLMDVTFDDRHIHNGEIVAHRPVIRVRVSDENKVLMLKDTSAFQLSLQKINDTAARPVYFSDPSVRFYPASISHNEALIVYKPKLSEGEYIFSSQAHDPSGNYSGPDPYKISFEVKDESAISNIYMYPNPFSYISHFYFSLTGSEIPESITIQIYNLAGQKVSEITKDQMGNVRIGENEFSWDGTDMSGHPLSDGMYLYRVIVKSADKVGHITLPEDVKLDAAYGKILITRE